MSRFLSLVSETPDVSTETAAFCFRVVMDDQISIRTTSPKMRGSLNNTAEMCKQMYFFPRLGNETLRQ
jgi:hypothetical protein